MAGHDVNDARSRSADVEFDRSLQFSKMFLSEPVVRGLTRNNFIHPSPIQARAIPLGKLGIDLKLTKYEYGAYPMDHIIRCFAMFYLPLDPGNGKEFHNEIYLDKLQFRYFACFFTQSDLLVQAKSGTGKTLVFAVLITEAHNPDITFPQSLTIVPTREIAVQIEGVLNTVGYSVPNFVAKSFIGGLDVTQDRKNLQKCSAVVGTPGRINHLIRSGVLNTSQIKILVLDEADSLISGTLKPEVETIIKTVPQKRQTVVCSATFYNNRDRELLKYLNEKFIGVTPKKEVPVLHGIRQFVRELPEAKDNIKEMMAKLAELNQIFKKLPFSQCLVFANTQTKAETYSSYLNRAGWSTEVIRGGQEQRVRMKTVENLKEFRCRILTATDVIARGIDAENVNLVINVDVPRDNSVYLHRIGRAGRFGTQAISITLVSSPKELERFRKIMSDIGGSEMFVYQLPVEAVEEIWNFEQYGEKYGKLFASKLEQEIRDQKADRSFLETIQEVDSKTELERKSMENLEDSLEELKGLDDSVLEADSIEQISSDQQKLSSKTTENDLDEEQVERIVSLCDTEHPKENVEVAASKIVDDLFLVAMKQVDAEETRVQGTGMNAVDLIASAEIHHRNHLEDPAVLGQELIDGLSDDEHTDELDRISKSSLQFGDEEIQKLISSSGCGESTSKTDQMFLDAMEKLELETDAPKHEVVEKLHTQVDAMFQEAMNKLEFDDSTVIEESEDTCNVPITKAVHLLNPEAKEYSVDQMFLSAMDKLDFEDSPNQEPTKNGETLTQTDEMFLAAMNKLDFEDSPHQELANGEFSVKPDPMLLVVIDKTDFGDDSVGDGPLKQSQPDSPSPELSCSTPESCYTTDSSFSSSATKKVEVGSNFTTPNSRVQEIRGAAPVHQVSSSTSDDSSELSHVSDPGVPTDQNCMSMEVNNDALFAKIMEQKELEADQQQRTFQFSIDGCSLEVHDDPVSDRDINSRKGSVPDVVPCGITMDPSRLQNRPSSTDGEVAVFDLNSNTCGSNHGSVFEHEEEAVVPQDQRPKRIRFQQDDLEMQSNSVGMMVGTSQEGEPVDPDPLTHHPISDAEAATEEAEDASSYSSEYDSESSNSSFFDQREWESESAKRDATDEQKRLQQEGASKTGGSRPKVSKRAKNATNLYHRKYASWTNQYWNQMTMIRDYARFAAYARQSSCVE